MKLQPLPRRAFLRGMGSVTIALPLLEAMIPTSLIGSAEAAAKAKKLEPHNRMMLLYYPNGIHTPAWYPQKDGDDYLSTPTLTPLQPFRKDIQVLGGLAVATAMLDTVGDHAKALSCYLTGVHIRKTASDDIQCAVSMDQVIANAIGDKTRFPSLELGLDYGRMEGGCDPGYACVYTNNVSWKDDKTPAIKEVNPRVVFDRLFGNGKAADHQGESLGQQELYDRSILDFTNASLAKIDNRLGSSDRHRVDEYLTSIREIEKRMDAPPSNEKLPKGAIRPTRVPDTFQEHFRLMTDLQILAMQQDVTRVSTFMLGVEQSRRTYQEIGIPEEHHGLTHHGGDPEKIAKVMKIDNYGIRQFAYYLDKMKSTREGDKTLLDNAMVIYGNGNGDAAHHDHVNGALILAGRGCGTLSPGRYTVYPDGTPISNLWLSMMDRMGVKGVERHGDSTGRLGSLSV